MTETFGLSPALAPPMANGELLFEAPWQARVFGMARALSEQGLYTWDEFRGARWKAMPYRFGTVRSRRARTVTTTITSTS